MDSPSDDWATSLMTIATFHRFVSLHEACVARLGKKHRQTRKQTVKHIYCVGSVTSSQKHLKPLDYQFFHAELANYWSVHLGGKAWIESLSFSFEYPSSCCFHPRLCRLKHALSNTSLLSSGRLRGAEPGCVRTLTESLNDVWAKKTGNHFFSLKLYHPTIIKQSCFFSTFWLEALEMKMTVSLWPVFPRSRQTF